MDLKKYSSVSEALSEVPDPRKARGQRYGWGMVMTVLVWAVACGQRTVHGIADWVTLHRESLIEEMGVHHSRLPSESTLRRALRQVDVEAVEERLRDFNDGLAARVAPESPGAVCSKVGWAIDGKAVRGAGHHGRRLCLVACVEHGTARVLDQIAVDTKSNEITAVPKLLAGKTLTGIVITMDALLTQRKLTQQILDQGGDYLLIAKDNQPGLFTTIALRFESVLPTESSRRVESVEKHHGRIERRVLEVLPAVDGWPGIKQIMRRTCTRTDVRSGKTSVCVNYGLTSLDPAVSSPDQLECLWRGHWTIENRVHYVRDVSMGEDAGQAHLGSTPQAMAALRNAVLNLFRAHQWTSIPDACRYYAASCSRAFQLVTSPPPPPRSPVSARDGPLGFLHERT